MPLSTYMYMYMSLPPSFSFSLPLSLSFSLHPSFSLSFPPSLPPSPQRWPKIRNRLRVVYGYELWSHHLKEVEGHFGTGVVSYFIFLRWLFLMNLIIFLLWFGLVVAPQVVWVVTTDNSRTPSQLACVFSLNFSATLPECPDGPPPITGADVSLGRRLVCRVGEEGGEGEGEFEFEVGACQFEVRNGTPVAVREDPSNSITVTDCSNITRCVCGCVCVWVWLCVWVCVCGCEREREGGREGEREREIVCVCVYTDIKASKQDNNSNAVDTYNTI